MNWFQYQGVKTKLGLALSLVEGLAMGGYRRRVGFDEKVAAGEIVGVGVTVEVACPF